MCILFAFVNNDAKTGEYKIIIISNRDEYYDRPTTVATQWENFPGCIGGIDLQPGLPPLGTWLGLSTKEKKIASVLNIVPPKDSARHKRRRGSLVSGFITGDSGADTYLNSIIPHATEYKPFNLLLMEESAEGKWEVSYFSPADERSPYQITEKILGLSNSRFDIPWLKVQKGTEEFHRIIKSANFIEKEQELIEKLLSVLVSTTSHLPDRHLAENAPLRTGLEPELLNAAQSAINVQLPQVRCGTRTNTLILVEANGAGKYIERTMKEPIDINNIIWDTTKIDFVMGE